MSIWQASFWLVVLGVGTIVFLFTLSVIGLDTDRSGETIHPEATTEENGDSNGEGEDAADDQAASSVPPELAGLFDLPA